MNATTATPSSWHRRVHVTPPPRLHRGLDGALWQIAGRWRRRQGVVTTWLARAEGILRAQQALAERSTQSLTADLTALQAAAPRGTTTAALDAGLALATEFARRTLELQAYREQIAGALALESGFLAEMATGEGKTLTIGLAAAVAGWRGQPVHVFTANDYLAERDATALRPFYHACGLTVGYIRGDMPPEVRRLHYARAVVYGSSKEIVADFLRDRLQLGERQDAERLALDAWLRGLAGAEPALSLVQRGLHTAIVDEADHVLIDEAVTPLLISQPQSNELLASAIAAAHAAAADFAVGRDFELERRHGEIVFTPAGRRRLAALSPETCLFFRNARWKEELVLQSLRAREFFLRGRHYIVDAGKIVIVDETTGRPAAQRSWRQGLHQAIEAKEGLALTPPNDNLASLSFQRFFRLYRRLAGVTGTCAENADELWRIYRLPVAILPTHRPGRRSHRPAATLVSAAEKWVAIVAEVAAVHATGRPVLVGCGAVAASEELARRLTAAGLEFALLNAAHLKREAEIVAEAGQPGRITVATHLAGRGTDIRLAAGIAALGGLHVIAADHAPSQRVDRQLYGRCARQGDAGSVRQFGSLDDELALRTLPAAIRGGLALLLRRFPLVGERLARLAWRHAQRSASRLDYRRRVDVLRRDEWLMQALPLWGLDQKLRER